jgi:hypothetical protein
MLPRHDPFITVLPYSIHDPGACQNMLILHMCCAAPKCILCCTRAEEWEKHTAAGCQCVQLSEATSEIRLCCVLFGKVAYPTHFIQ